MKRDNRERRSGFPPDRFRFLWGSPLVLLSLLFLDYHTMPGLKPWFTPAFPQEKANRGGKPSACFYENGRAFAELHFLIFQGKDQRAAQSCVYHIAVELSQGYVRRIKREQPERANRFFLEVPFVFCLCDQSEVPTYSRCKKIVRNHSDNQCVAQKHQVRESENRCEQHPHREREKENYRGGSFNQLHWQALLDLLLYGALGGAGLTVCYLLFSLENRASPSVGDFFAYLLCPGRLRELLQGGGTVDAGLTLMSWTSLMYVVEGFRSALSQWVKGRGKTAVCAVVFGLWTLPLVLLLFVWHFPLLAKLGWFAAYLAILRFLVRFWL